MRRIKLCIIAMIIACFVIPANSFGASEPDIYVDPELDIDVYDDEIGLYWNGYSFVEEIIDSGMDIDSEQGCDLFIVIQCKKPGTSSYSTIEYIDYLEEEGSDCYFYEPIKDGRYSFRIRAEYRPWVYDDDYEDGGYVSNRQYSDWTYASAYYASLKAPVLSAKTAGKNSIKLSWSKVDNADGYKIYRSTSKNGTYKLVKTINSRSTVTWTNKSLTNGKKYYYYVAAFRDEATAKSGKKSAYAGVKKPTVSSVKISGIQNMKIKWSKVDGASGYEIYRKTTSKGKYKKIKTITSGSTTSFLDKGTVVKKKYFYKIKAYKYINGNKVESNYSTAKSRYITPNEFVGKIDYKFYDADYGEIVIQVRKLSYVNGKLQMKAFVQYVDDYFHVNKFNWIRFTIKSEEDGKLIAKQKFYDKPINLDGYDYKFVTFTFDEGTKRKINLRDIDIEYYWHGNYSYRLM